MARRSQTRNAGRSQSHKFSEIPGPNVPRSAFNRSFSVKTTLHDGGVLYPILVDEMLPGDTINITPTLFARMATPLHPILDNVYVDFHLFFCPYRILWDNFPKFMGEQTDPGDSTDYIMPTVDVLPSNGGAGSLWDYMGVPPNAPHTVNAMPSRAYNKIFTEWFRDENMVDSPSNPRDDGPDNTVDFLLRHRGKRHDYMTSSLPWPQKGPAVNLPLGDSAPIERESGGSYPTWDIPGGNTAMRFSTTGGTGENVEFDGNPGASNVTFGWGSTIGLQADLSSATAATINEIRQAFQIQKLYERDARGGTRYQEILRSHFGVISPDARLQRPEFLGSLSFPLGVNSVPQTSTTDNEPTPQGSLSAFVQGIHRGRSVTKSFTEHGVLMGIASVRADLSYQQGINRMWNRSTRWDYYWPALSHLGEQAVLQKEIFATNTAADDDVFGYQERYAEYRYKDNQVSGLMRSMATQSLDTWHLSQEFASAPTLNEAFIQEDPPIDRVVAVINQPKFLLDAHFKYNHVRPMPTYSVPGLVDHF